MSVLAVLLTLAGLTVSYRIHRQAGAEAPATHTEGADQSAPSQSSSQHSRSLAPPVQPPQTRPTA